MSMFLNLQAQKSDQGMVAVEWNTGARNRGVLTVDMRSYQLEEKYMLAAAELAAIRHLILTQNVFNRDNTVGRGIVVRSTRGAIKKAWEGKGQEELKRFVYFKQRLPLLAFETQRKYYQGEESSEVEPVLTSHIPQLLPYEKIDTSIGPVTISYHAMERFEEYMEGTQPDAKKTPLEMMLARLSNPSLKQFELDEKVQKHKDRKYGKNDGAEHWAVPGSRFHFLMMPDDNQEVRQLITTYLQAPKHV